MLAVADRPAWTVTSRYRQRRRGLAHASAPRPALAGQRRAPWRGGQLKLGASSPRRPPSATWPWNPSAARGPYSRARAQTSRLARCGNAARGKGGLARLRPGSACGAMGLACDTPRPTHAKAPLHVPRQCRGSCSAKLLSLARPFGATARDGVHSTLAGLAEAPYLLLYPSGLGRENAKPQRSLRACKDTPKPHPGKQAPSMTLRPFLRSPPRPVHLAL